MTDMTDKSKHTPEPWAYNEHTHRVWADTHESEAYNHSDAIICDVSHYTVADREGHANAARIVACVNAMADIDDPQKLRETWEAIKHLELDAYHKMKEERDALLEYATDIYKVVTQTPSTSKQQTALLNKVLELAINMKGVTHAS